MLLPPAGFHFIRRLLVAFLFTAALFSRITAASGPHTLTVTVSGSGTVSRNPNFPQYPNGSVVTLTATPDSGFLFSHWTGDLTGSSNPANIEMTSSRTVVAHFVPIPEYTVTTSVSGQGTVTLNPSGGTYPSNTVVTATATAAQGWIFASWTGDAEGNSNPLQLTIDENKSITANFAESVKITNPPDDVSTNSGSSVTFEVAANGTPPLQYQWSLDGQPIPGATEATLVISNVQPTDEGTYSVIVSNLYSSATAAAMLRLTDFECTGPNVVTEPTEQALRSAIAAGGHVRLCFNGTITLTQPITVTKNVALDATARQVTISGNNSTRIFNVETNVTLALTNLTLTGGMHRGSDRSNGGLPGYGGAIWNHGGTLVIVECALTNNVAMGGNGLDSTIPGAGGSGSGGAIFSEYGTIKVISSTISSNAAAGGRGNVVSETLSRAPGGSSYGGGIASIAGSTSILDSSLEANFSGSGAGGPGSVASHGGGLYFTNTAGLISNSVLRANVVTGRSTSINGPIPAENASPAFGGAVEHLAGHLEIVRSIFTGNSARGGHAGGGGGGAVAAGGALFSDGPVAIRFSTISSNQSIGGTGRHGGALGSGGAWHNTSQSSASECLFSENIAIGGNGANNILPQPAGHAFGGAIENQATLSVTNCTFSLNVVRPGYSTAIPSPLGNSAGGAVYNTGSFLAVNATFASNETSFVPGTGSGGSFFGANIANTNGTVTLRNTILAYPNGTNSNVHGPITDGGHNISSDDSANFNSGTSFNFTDPRLEQLADNGGPTLTMALQEGSPAIDFGASQGAPAIDQRGFPRPMGAGVDIGAYEFNSGIIIVDYVLTITLDEDAVQLLFHTEPAKTYEIQSSTLVDEWTTIETITASSGTITREYPPAGSARFYRLLAR